MSNTENEVEKIKTQIVPAIHNTVSLQVYLKTEDGKFTMSDLRDAFYRGIETIQNGNC